MKKLPAAPDVPRAEQGALLIRKARTDIWREREERDDSFKLPTPAQRGVQYPACGGIKAL
ncbi:MAG: hypothetical protein DBX55_01795 [Verrucomicrobia bacterium]|nr:MAG: hypothetical protein DBX55_01795 [Verrucomicrobiota bacterium]